MKNSNYYVGKGIKYIWTTFAVLLVCFAASISFIRYSLPYLDNHKAVVENWIEQEYGIAMTFGHVGANWTGASLQIVLQDVSLRSATNAASPLDFAVKKTHIDIDFWRSIAARKLKSKRFDLDGLALTLDLPALEQGDGNRESSSVIALESLFLNQLQRFAIIDSRITLKTTDDQQTFMLQRVAWENRGDRHQAVGQLRVQELARNSAYFVLDLFGTQDNLRGNFYAKAEALDLSPWLNQLGATQLPLQQSRGNFVFWAGITDNSITDIQLQLQESEFSWQDNEQELSAKIKGGHIYALPDVDGWRIRAKDILLQVEEQVLLTDWLGIANEAGLTLRSDSRFEVESLLQLAPLALHKSELDVLTQLSPNLRINRLTAQLSDQDVQLALDFDQLTWKTSGRIPGIKNLRGQYYWNTNQGKLILSGQEETLDIANLFKNDIPFRSLDLALFVQQDPQTGWEINIPHFSIDSDALTLASAANYQFQSGQLRLTAQLEQMTAQQAKALLSPAFIGPNTRGYLNRSLESGRLEKAEALWQGQLSDFPFANDEGIFQAALHAKDMSFAFDKRWPSLTQMDALVLFENASLSVTSPSAQLMGVQVSGANALIPDLSGNSYVEVHATGRANAPSVTDVIMASNLKNNLGKVLKNQLILQDDLSAKLDFHIPLTGENIRVNGDVTLANNRVYVDAIRAELTGVAGNLIFENEALTINGLVADLLGQEISIDAQTFDSESGYQADLTISANWQVETLLEKHSPGLLGRLSGASNWSADVHLQLPKSGYQYSIDWRSSLHGLTSNLPEPFSIDPTIGLLSKAKIEGDQQATRADIWLGEQIRFSGIVPHAEMQFSRAGLAIGETDVMNMGMGFSITANLQQAKFEPWFNIVNDFVMGLPQSNKPLLGQPERIYINAEEFILAGQKVEDLELVAKQQEGSWLLTLNSEQARADVYLFKDWQGKGIDIQADFIHLQEWHEMPTGNTSEPVDYSNLPPISFACDQCTWQDKNLGTINLQLTPNEQGMHIDQAILQTRHGRMQASGDWSLNTEQPKTQISGEFTSTDIGAYLMDLALNSGIKDSGAKIDFNLDWQGAPHEFNVASLNGDMQWRLSDGYLTELPDGGSRIFSLLSLESLVRKLSLDFRDVFAKGFFYDKMTGSFSAKNGVVSTQDTVIDGGAGEMTIVGNTNLENQKLNYQVGFTPNVTSSVPLLVYFMVNPASAIAAFALDEALTEAKVISHVRYSITGTIEDPIATQIKRDSKSINLPAKADSPDAPASEEAAPSAPEEIPGTLSPNSSAGYKRTETANG